MLRADQVNNRFVSGNKSGVDGIGGKEISITKTQGITLVSDAQFQGATDNPMRLILSVSVWSILCARRIAPLKDAVTLALQTVLEFGRVRRGLLNPSFDFNTHVILLPRRHLAASCPGR